MKDILTDEQICKAVEMLHDESISMLEEFVAYPSLLGQEAMVQEWMYRKFEQLEDDHLKVESIPILGSEIENKLGYSPVLDWKYGDQDSKSLKNKVSIVATRFPVGQIRGRSLILNGHVDVVPTGPESMWTNHPFVPVIKDGRLYGRGSGDMKSGIVAFYYAYKALKMLGYAPASPIQMQTVVEEECTGNGTLSIAGKFQADGVIIPEPFNQIVTAQLGVTWLRITLWGKPVHVLEASSGVNAVEAAYKVIQSLHELEDQWNHSIQNDHNTSPGHYNNGHLFQSLLHPIHFNLGVIQGGEWPSSVPSQVTFQLRISHFPGVNLNQVKIDIEKCILNACNLANVKSKIEYHGFQAEGTALASPNSSLVNSLKKAHQYVYQQEPLLAPVTCTTDARFFQLYNGFSSTCYGPEATNIHGIDESVSIESIKNVTKVLALFIAHWCGLEKIPTGPHIE